MNIQFVSDLHLEIPRNAKHFQSNKIIPRGDILILAGDTMCWDYNAFSNSFWDDLSLAFSQVLVIPGNHEFYKGYDVASMQNSMHGVIRENIKWYYNKSVEINGVQIILSTLWSYIPLDISERVMSCCNDFCCIQYDGQLITIDKYNEENKSCIDFITKELEKDCSKRIVVTHHAPILDVVGEDVCSSWFAALYANSLDELIKENNIDYWIYGHSHNSRQIFNLHDTILVSNSCGYLGKRENPLFDPSRTISL